MDRLRVPGKHAFKQRQRALGGHPQKRRLLGPLCVRCDLIVRRVRPDLRW